jgi:hypothetical protein
MYQLRTYTLKTAGALERYATVHWPRHIISLRAFGDHPRNLDSIRCRRTSAGRTDLLPERR